MGLSAPATLCCVVVAWALLHSTAGMSVVEEMNSYRPPCLTTVPERERVIYKALLDDTWPVWQSTAFAGGLSGGFQDWSWGLEMEFASSNPECGSEKCLYIKMGSSGAFRLHSIVPFLQVGAVRMKVKVKFHVENSNLDHSLTVAVADRNDNAAQIGIVKEIDGGGYQDLIFPLESPCHRMGLENELQQLNILFLRKEELQLQESDYVEFFIHDIAIDRLWPMTRKGKESITSEYMGEEAEIKSALANLRWLSEQSWSQVERSLPRSDCQLQDMLGTWSFSAGGRCINWEPFYPSSLSDCDRKDEKCKPLDLLSSIVRSDPWLPDDQAAYKYLNGRGLVLIGDSVLRLLGLDICYSALNLGLTDEVHEITRVPEELIRGHGHGCHISRSLTLPDGSLANIHFSIAQIFVYGVAPTRPYMGSKIDENGECFIHGKSTDASEGDNYFRYCPENPEDFDVIDTSTRLTKYLLPAVKTFFQDHVKNEIFVIMETNFWDVHRITGLVDNERLLAELDLWENQAQQMIQTVQGQLPNSKVAWFTMSEPFSGLGTTMPASSVEALNHAARISAKNARAEVIDFGAMMRGCAQLTSNTGLPCDGYIQMQESLCFQHPEACPAYLRHNEHGDGTHPNTAFLRHALNIGLNVLAR